MMKRILVTGGLGLVGAALKARLEELGWTVRNADIRVPPGVEGFGDVLDALRLARLAEGCSGIVHLAAVSRVAWGQRDPDLCWQVNVQGTSNVLRVALMAEPRPWVLFASSREVYGEPQRLPVLEDDPLRPLNSYGRSKAEAERLVEAARNYGLSAAIVRFSNVFGAIDDHADRVVPAFARAAALGQPLTVHGWDHTFDFTPLDDTVEGIVRLIDLLDAGRQPPPPIHLATGRPITLGELAEMTVSLAGGTSPVIRGPERTYDVTRFVGDPSRAAALLDWRSTTPVEQVLGHMIAGYRRQAALVGA
jgi:UDP-glucose 4-epimerase